MQDEEKQLNLSRREEKILEFWKAHKVFQETLKKNKKGKLFIFYEGPPTANGRPGIHHVLTRVFKDAVLRYKTMQGFFVPRRAGWDTHGLPVEIGVEKELGFKTKHDIERYGIAPFNKKAKESVWKYKDEWERFTKRIGFWLDLEHPYITYETSYIETLWWIIKEVWNKKLLYRDFKVTPWCPRCQTGLSSHEVGQGYKKVTDQSVFVKFRIKEKKDEFLLVWTTTPWTLPANVAIAVNPKIEYTKFKLVSEKTGREEFLWSAVTPPYDQGDALSVVEKVSGTNLVGLGYEPLYKAWNNLLLLNHEKPPYIIVAADFVSLGEGTGMVHLAPAFGEEDMTAMREFAKEKTYPILHTVNADGTMKKGVMGEGKFIKDADKDVIEDLKQRKLLYRVVPYEHDYPFCWRCATPLLYFARDVWWIRMSSLREKLLLENAGVKWIPEHIKDGRFGEFLREVRDWAFSRERYWGTPLPVWECGKCGKRKVIGGIQELSACSPKPKNKYIMMRHGESDSNVGHVVVSEKKGFSLTEKGKHAAKETAEMLTRKKIDIIISSPIARARETAEIVGGVLGKKVILDDRLSEINVGVFNGRDVRDYHSYYRTLVDKFSRPAPEGESLADVWRRMMAVIKDCEEKYSGKRILVVSHEYPLWMLFSGALGLSNDDALNIRKGKRADNFINFAEAMDFKYVILPRDEDGVVNLHRPYVDGVTFPCEKCGSEMSRVTEVVDGWFDSGAMPYAQQHFPFNKEKLIYPADYICEAVDQTRGWFYTLLAVGTLLGKGAPYKTVISMGHVLDKNGQKMSKSKGNIVEPNVIMEKYGADALRWYFYTVNLPGEPKQFDEKDLINKLHNFLGTVWNMLIFFETYVDSVKSNVLNRKSVKKNILDQWVLARAQACVSEVTKKIDLYDIMGATRAIEEFAIYDVSQWYVRRSRRRFQHSDSKKDFEDASETLARVLLLLVKLCAPFVPFFSEILYQSLRKKMGLKTASIHLEEWPKSFFSSDKNEEVLLSDMEQLRKFVTDALKLRANKGIKVRQPLRCLTLSDASFQNKKELLTILKDEINVKEIDFGDSFLLDTVITPELREEGLVREIIRNIQEMRKELGLGHREEIKFQLCGNERIMNIIRRWESRLKKDAGARVFLYGGKKIFRGERELLLDQENLWMGIS